MRASAGIVALLLLTPAYAYDAAPATDLFALSFEELSETSVRIATGTPKLLGAAPAATSIITAADLEAMGAQDIDEALEMVPGLHVSHASFVNSSRYFIRGIVSTYNPHTLVLINGIPQTSLFTGDRGERVVGMSGLPVKAIERIEIIRGPGSAVYGADAFAGVINIITKAPEKIHGGIASAAYGSFNTWRTSLVESGDIGPVQAMFSLTYGESDGDDPIITRDNQSVIDAQTGTAASLAPGPSNMAWKNFDARTDLLWEDFRLRVSLRRSESETGQGINESLDPTARFPHRHGTVDLTWNKPNLWKDWDLESQISYLYSDFRNPTYIRQFPAGAFDNIFPNGFPDGVLQRPELSEENARFHVTAVYNGWDAHRIRFGAGTYWGDLFKTTDATNYELVEVAPGVIVPSPLPLQDVSDTDRAFLPENQRTNSHVFVQDEWRFADHWELTAGVRHDHYSDVGNTVNPRVALVWNTTETFTSKLFYGEAFRPPAFFELYARNNPVAQGNPDLKPETLNNVELAFSWQVTPALRWDINTYKFRIYDYIDFVSDGGAATTFTAQNVGNIDGRGVETEVHYQISKPLRLLANISHQQTRDRTTGEPLGLAPNTDASLRIVWVPLDHWQLTPQVVWFGPSKRQAGDARDDMDGYTTLDLTVRRQLPKNTALTLIARNIADADVREATRGPEGTQTEAGIANDLPQAGRSVTMEATLRW